MVNSGFNQDNIIGVNEIPISSGSANTTNLFRYDSDNNQYIYNLSTITMSAGDWQLKVVLDDDRDYRVKYQLGR